MSNQKCGTFNRQQAHAICTQHHPKTENTFNISLLENENVLQGDNITIGIWSRIVLYVCICRAWVARLCLMHLYYEIHSEDVVVCMNKFPSILKRIIVGASPAFTRRKCCSNVHNYHQTLEHVSGVPAITRFSRLQELVVANLTTVWAPSYNIRNASALFCYHYYMMNPRMVSQRFKFVLGFDCELTDMLAHFHCIASVDSLDDISSRYA